MSVQVTVAFGPGAFTGDDRWVETHVRPGVSVGDYTALSPRQVVTAVPCALFALDGNPGPQGEVGPAGSQGLQGEVGPAGPLVGVGTETPTRPPHVAGATLIDNDLEVTGTLTANLPAGSITGPELGPGAVNTTVIQDGTVTVADLDTSSVDGRYVLKAGDTMTGALTTPGLTVPGVIHANSLIRDIGILSIESSADIEFQIDRNNNGSLAAAFEIFNGAGEHAFLVSESGNGRVFENFTVDSKLAVGGASATTLEASVYLQLDPPDSVSLPRMRIRSPVSDNGFGIEFSNPGENWYVGPNIGNWADNRFVILADSANQGIIVATNGNVAIDSVAAASPFARLTVDGTIGFPTVASPML